jgi:hypothetical protein
VPAPAPDPGPAPSPDDPSAPADPSGGDTGYPGHGTTGSPIATATPPAAGVVKRQIRHARPVTRRIRRVLHGRHGLNARTSGPQTRAARASAHRQHQLRNVDLEGTTAGGATVWLNRTLPDPTPPALRLTPAFASRLYHVSKNQGADWALVLGILRAEGHLGSAPAGRVLLARTAAKVGRLAGRPKSSQWTAAFAFAGSTGFATRATSLANYYRAVGLRALVRGLMAERKAIATRLLHDGRVSIYGPGREDVRSGRVNVRVNAMIEYLAESFGQVTVSCLISGHRLYARPGVVSAHIYGLAADISSVGGVSILGHQQPGSITEHAVRALLLLPPELQPRQIISLLGLGGPSFPLANHYNHIHVGY